MLPFRAIVSDRYRQQHRGDAGAYDLYLRGMDTSMRQKVALTAAHLLCEGDVADMGMGSGSGSHALAALYPELSVVGVDVSAEMVARARDRYPLDNLRFIEGDVAEPVFEAGTMEAIINSSVLHHVTSFGGYDRAAALRALRVQTAELAEQGVIILRDFVDPGPGEVWLDVSAEDGHDDAQDVMGCSTARLLERFSREFRSLLPEAERGFPCVAQAATEACPVAPGFVRYQLGHTHAVEFVLRKDYRASWDVEVQEEYTYATQPELESALARLGLRVLASTPLCNPWIVAHRFRGHFALWSLDGSPLDWPSTNYVIVGQKVPAHEGVVIREVERAEPASFLELSHHRHQESGVIYDLARRPGRAIDIIPWFERAGVSFMLARRSYPRPVLACRADGWQALDGSTPSSYVTEPLLTLATDKPLGETVEDRLAQFAAIGRDGIRGIEPGQRYLPSAGGLLEQVESVFVEIAPTNVDEQLENRSGFSTAGTLRAIETRQLLRAAQVGGLPDARLELNAYELLQRRRIDPGEWIGEAVELSDGPAATPTSIAALRARSHRRAFRPTDEPGNFLVVHSAVFEEQNAAGDALHRQVREWVMPRELSRTTLVVAALRRWEGRIYMGLDDDDLPAAQCFSGNSEMLVAPAWRLPRAVSGRARSRAWVSDQLEQLYGVAVGEVWELGGPSHPAAGLTPEIVFPLAVSVDCVTAAQRALHWVALDELVAERRVFSDGHLSVMVWRAAHATGLLAG